MSDITVIMPAYNSEKYIREAIDSICNQTFTDWDMLIINEYGSDDSTASIVCEYEKKDSRIHLVQNEHRLGLAESLNRGMRLAQGQYIARMDADDISHSDRLQKQWEYMENHKDVIALGTAQHHFGSGTDWIHRPATDENQLKANLLFLCDVCHSTVMLRREVFIQNSLFYNPDYFAEDYELWTRAIHYGKIMNMPDVLGEYRWAEGNITKTKKKLLAEESGRIVGRNLKEHLHMQLSEQEMFLMNGWNNPCMKIGHRRRNLKEIEKILRKVFEQNRKIHYVDDACMLQVIGAKWRWDKFYESITNGRAESDLESIFSYQGYHTLMKRSANYVIRKIKYS